MVIRSHGGDEPDVHESAFVDETAVVVGNVTIEADASVWPNATVRGDHGGEIVLREGANVQDNAVLHEGTEVGPYATVGHGAVVHGCVLREKSLVGMNAVVLDDSVVGEQAMVGAASLVGEGTEIEPKTLVAGNPAEVKKEIEGESPWSYAGEVYVGFAKEHAETSEVLHERWPPEE